LLRTPRSPVNLGDERAVADAEVNRAHHHHADKTYDVPGQNRPRRQGYHREVSADKNRHALGTEFWHCDQMVHGAVRNAYCECDQGEHHLPTDVIKQRAEKQRERYREGNREG
jgi:hypothetical protein